MRSATRLAVVRRGWPLLVPAAFFVFALAYPTGNHHWDVLERAWIVDHPLRCMHSFDATPRSLFLHFAHPIELPLAAALGAILPGVHGLDLLRVYASLCGAIALWFVGALVALWRTASQRYRGGHVTAALVAQASVATALSVWKMGSGGEEKMLGLAAQLGFLMCFWRALATAGDVSAQRRWTSLAAGALPLAVLAHLASGVLVPFAAIVVWRVRDGALRRALAVRLAIGAATAGVALVAIAALTADARSPVEFWNYVTFYHHGIENFFEVTGAPEDPGSRLVRILHGVESFFSGVKLDGFVPALLVIVVPAAFGIESLWSDRKRDQPGMRLGLQVAILVGLWSLHFAFFEPNKYESWTLPASLGVVALGSLLPSGRWALTAFALPVFLVAVNVRHYRWNHRPNSFAGYFTATVRASRPQDFIFLVGGRQDGRPLRGSLWTRYMLSTERERTVVSLYDVTGLTEPEYWGRPYTSVDSLQAALDRGRRAWAPAFLGPEFDLLRTAQLLDITWEARGDSVIEVTRVVEIPEPDTPQPRIAIRPDATSKRVALIPYRKRRGVRQPPLPP